MAEAVVLDTSACIALLEDEPGADFVETTLLEARAAALTAHGSFVTLTEVEYILTQERGAADAASALGKMKAWPVIWHHSNEGICGAAAKLKARHRISFADSFVAALAKERDAILIHKGPEFEALGAEVKQRVLPLKAGVKP